jgi:hypothetical protein
MTVASLTFDGLDEIERAFAQAPEVVLDEAETFLNGLVIFMAGEVQERTPVAQGTLRQSIQAGDVIRTDTGVAGSVGTALSYAVPVEIGSAPHMPPVAPLQDWVKVKLGLTGDDGKAVAWAIARKIAKVGTKGAFMFQRAFDENQAEAQRQFALMIGRIKARIAGAA